MISKTLRAFQSRNYRLYFTGQSCSMIGTWMQRTAVSWLIYETTHSAFMLGVAAFASQFPSFMFSILGGVVSDRFNRYKVMMLTQVASLLQAVLLTLLVFSGQYATWQILVLSVILGTINAFDVPARQALIYDMVENKEHLPNAIALNSSLVHMARLIGPSLAGIVLYKFGSSACFLLNACSFLAVITSMLFMKLPPYRKSERMTNAFMDLKNGLTYLRNTPSIGQVMLMLALVSLFSLPYITLLPIYAKEIFEGEATTFGYLNSMVGLGALGGAIFLASLSTGVSLKRTLFINTIIFGVGLILFSHLTSLIWASPFLVMVGFGMMSQTTISNTLIQTMVTPAMRGRVISYYAMAFFGMQPIGAVLIGALSHAIGVPNTFLVQGIITLLIALYFMPYLKQRELRQADKLKIGQLEEHSAEAS